MRPLLEELAAQAVEIGTDPDPVSRDRRARELSHQIGVYVAQLGQLRADAVAELVAPPESVRRAAPTVGVSFQQVARLAARSRQP